MSNVIDFSVFLQLPKHLQVTLYVIHAMGRCTAPMICRRTHKARAVESAYANVLVAMNLVRKARVKHRVWFIDNVKEDDLAMLTRVSRLTPEDLAFARQLASAALDYFVVILDKITENNQRFEKMPHGRKRIKFE